MTLSVTRLTPLLTLLAFLTTVTVSQTCQRLKYYGSPINLVHRGQEQIHELLQVANVNTNAFFVGNQTTFFQASNTISQDFLYYINDGTAGTIQKALALRISSRNGIFFLDEYAMLDLKGSPVPNYSYILGTRFNLGAFVPAITSGTFKECPLIKEEFTYWYEFYPSRFEKKFN